MTLATLVLLGAGIAGGYLYADGSDEAQRPAPAVSKAKAHSDARPDDKRLLAVTAEVCRAATELRSAYTRRVIGHSERCRVTRRSSSDVPASRPMDLLASICIDIRKATRTANLPDANCPKAERPVRARGNGAKQAG